MSDAQFAFKLVVSKLVLLAAALGLLVATARSSRAQALTVLYTFTGGTDGVGPYAGVALDGQGNLYGETVYGGDSRCAKQGCGTLFKLTQGGTETVLYRFPSGVKAQPVGGLTWDTEGNLYGTTQGFNAVDGGGGVFELENGINLTWLHIFLPSADVYFPNGVVMDVDGNLYGATSEGGAEDGGIVFKVTPRRKETVVYNFAGGSDGRIPEGGLIWDAQGNLYGTTVGGGGFGCQDIGGCGTVFKVTPRGTETVLYRFAGGVDGALPVAALVMDEQGNLYGTTQNGGGTGCLFNSGVGCGTVFKLTPGGTETVLYAFTGGADGANPWAGLAIDAQGNLYGTTNQGGVGCQGYGCGTVFMLTPSGRETVLYRFTGGADGAYPSAGLIFDAQGNLYGTAPYGGNSSCNRGSGCGVVFKLTP
ncbi:MAG: choice-of-anchor tandem repeat GloVer-containing protein [Terriglobales bacterium]|jgi:uncharacterized repeat protein (TIGR03803 family)